MSSEKLVKAIITGPTERAEEAIRSLVLEREFHALPAAATIKNAGALTALSDADPYKSALTDAARTLDTLGIKPRFEPFAERGLTPETAGAYVASISERADALVAGLSEKRALIDSDVELISRLRPYGELAADIGELLSVRYLERGFGFVTAGLYPALAAYAEGAEDVYLFRAGVEGERINLVYLALPGKGAKAVSALSELGFELADAPSGEGLCGVPSQKLPELERNLASANEAREKLEGELASLAKAEGAALLAAYSYLRFMSAGAEKRSLCAEKDGQFYLTGWLPESKKDDFAADAGTLGFDFTAEKPTLGELKSVPVKFTDGFFNRIFAPFVKMYGYPDYGEIDPRLFMTITYCVLFGIMFGDIGQGAVLVALGLLLAKKGQWLGRIIAAVGASAMITGAVYGSVFGNEHLLPGFKVLEEGNLTNILLVSAGVGVVLIIACGVINIITGFRQRDYKKAIFSANGVCGVIFISALVAGAVATLLFKIDLLGTPLYTVPLLLLPLLLIWMGEPMVWLLEGRHGKAPSIGMVALEGFFDLFESCLSWFSNILSFLRVGTYTICHAIMMLVVYTLSANGNGGYSILGLVFGNALVMLIEAVLVCIQVLRLEFYELFGRFYTGRGTPFESNAVDYADPGARAA